MKKKDSKIFIPVSEPALTGQELKYVCKAVKTGWISSSGCFLEEFERRWAAYCGRQYGVAVSSGTTALQLAVVALGLKPGDEVILPAFTIISCVTAVTYSGCVPVLVDADPVTGCMDVTKIRQKITKRTKAIMPVHIYGHPVDMDAVIDLAKKHDLYIIEDAAEAHGAEYLSGRTSKKPLWRRCGSFGDISCFSFYANKLLTTGEGGMVLTDDPVLAEKFRYFRNLCFGGQRRFLHESLGFNFRMTNLQAALGVAQLNRFDKIVNRKRHIGKRYFKRLSSLKKVTLLKEQPWARSVWWMFGVMVEDSSKISSDLLSKKLRELGIETRPFFLGMHEQPALKKQGFFKNETYPVSEAMAKRGLYLPSGVALTDDQIDRVVAAVKRVLQ